MTFPVPLRQMLPLLGITVSAFVFNTSEFMPIALLMDISQSFDQTEAETGIMITVYAWMVAILSLPLMLAAGKMKEKTLLLLTLLLFALGQLASGMAPSFPLLMGARILVASAHAIFWSIAAPWQRDWWTKENRPLPCPWWQPVRRWPWFLAFP